MTLQLARVATVRQAKDDDVGGHRFAFRDPRKLFQKRFNLGCPLVVFGQAIHVVVQGEQGRCGQVAGLAHAAAKAFADPTCVVDEIAVAHQDGTHGGPQSFAETQRNAVE